MLSSAVAGAPAEACALEYRGFLHAFVQIARCEGLRGLYKGLLPSLLLVRPSVGVRLRWSVDQQGSRRTVGPARTANQLLK